MEEDEDTGDADEDEGEEEGEGSVDEEKESPVEELEGLEDEMATDEEDDTPVELLLLDSVPFVMQDIADWGSAGSSATVPYESETHRRCIHDSSWCQIQTAPQLPPLDSSFSRTAASNPGGKGSAREFAHNSHHPPVWYCVITAGFGVTPPQRRCRTYHQSSGCRLDRESKHGCDEVLEDVWRRGGWY